MEHNLRNNEERHLYNSYLLVWDMARAGFYVRIRTLISELVHSH